MTTIKFDDSSVLTSSTLPVVGRPPVSTLTHTLDDSQIDGWSLKPEGEDRGRIEARIRLLYHIDLARIGALTGPEALVPGQPCVVGRRAPLFLDPALRAAPRPLDDPLISRKQLTVRWLPEAGVFEVSPSPEAKRPLSLVDLSQGSLGVEPAAQLQPIHGPVMLSPGACLAIGDRALICLEAIRRSGNLADRMSLVGDSEAMWRLREDIEAVARFDGPALITGPTGSGKELVARAIHDRSPRSKGPFIPVNCGAVPEHLVESVFFGHRKGAFTGADSHEAGLFMAADGGTLFLDELGELPAAIQPKLLRVLQDGIVTPVGSHTGKQTHVRVVAATHRDLEAEIDAGRLRADLYHRVAAHLLQTPPLYQRIFDVPGLFVHFLTRLKARHPELEWLWAGGRERRPTVPIRFVADLMRLPWAGNVRELEHLAERVARYTLQAGVFKAPPLDAVRQRGAFISGEMATPPGLLAGTSAQPVGGRLPPGAAQRGERPPAVMTPGSMGAPPEPAAPEAVGQASAALGLAHKTIAKLLDAATLTRYQRQAEAEGWSEAQYAEALQTAGADALYRMLVVEDFNRTRAAARADMSRNTFAKVLKEFGLKRASELSPGEIEAARLQAEGDLARAAELLRVSPKGLRQQITLLNLKQSQTFD